MLVLVFQECCNRQIVRHEAQPCSRAWNGVGKKLMLKSRSAEVLTENVLYITRSNKKGTEHPGRPILTQEYRDDSTDHFT